MENRKFKLNISWKGIIIGLVSFILLFNIFEMRKEINQYHDEVVAMQEKIHDMHIEILFKGSKTD